MTLLVTFYSVSSALYAQKLLEKQRMPCKVVPVPRSVSSSCGYAVDISGTSVDVLTAALNGSAVEWEAVYHVLADKKAERYELIKKCTDGGPGNV